METAGLPAAAPGAPPADPAAGFHSAVSAFKRRLIETTLQQAGGNRSHAARTLGLQRTYLLRLMREFQIDVPRAAGRGPDGASPSGPPPGRPPVAPTALEPARRAAGALPPARGAAAPPAPAPRRAAVGTTMAGRAGARPKHVDTQRRAV